MVLCLCLGVVAVIVHGRSQPTAAVKPERLDEAFTSVGPWATGEVIGFEDRVIDVLRLDDYTHRMYTNGKDKVWLYVGYYLGSAAIGASHSPLVCYPGQGWRLSDKQSVVLEPLGHRLRLMSLTATKRGHKDLVYYWFQAYDRSAPDTFQQKLQAMWVRLAKGKSESAFVRITVPVGPEGPEYARRTATAFAEAFYPQFQAFVTGGP